METYHYHDGMIRPEVAVSVLKKNGIIVTIEEAKSILEFMYFMAHLSMDQHFTDNKSLDKTL
jgi:hypothetical protein